MIHPTTLSVSDKTVEIRYLVTGRSSTAYTPTKYVYDRGAQIADTRSPGQLNFVLWLLISAGPQYGTCFMSPFWRLEYLRWRLDFSNIYAPPVKAN